MGRVSEIEPAATFGKVPLAVSTLTGKKASKKHTRGSRDCWRRERS
jgi:hypothetical protein